MIASAALLLAAEVPEQPDQQPMLLLAAEPATSVTTCQAFRAAGKHCARPLLQQNHLAELDRPLIMHDMHDGQGHGGAEAYKV